MPVSFVIRAHSAFDHRRRVHPGRKKRSLVLIDRDADHKPVHQRRGAVDYIKMPQRDRIERPRVKADAHGRPFRRVSDAGEVS